MISTEYLIAASFIVALVTGIANHYEQHAENTINDFAFFQEAKK